MLRKKITNNEPRSKLHLKTHPKVRDSADELYFPRWGTLSRIFAPVRMGLLLASLAFVLTSCSSVRTQKASIALSAISSERFQLMVRTGNPVMDKIVYEMVFQQFNGIIPLKEQEPYTGAVEVSFLSSDQNAFFGTSNSFGSATAYGSGWYTGTGYVGGNAVLAGASTTLSSGGVLTWQNSTMLIVIKNRFGDRLWTADYNYKGGWELSGFAVNTPDEAARLVLKRLKDKFISDFKKS